MLYTDPSGNKLIVSGANKKIFNAILKIAGMNWYSMEKDGSVVYNNIQGCSRYPIGDKLISEIIKSKFKVKVKNIKGREYYTEPVDIENYSSGKKCGSIISLYHKSVKSKTSDYVLGENSKILYKEQPYYIILAHELIHALRIIKGKLIRLDSKKVNPFIEKINKQFNANHDKKEPIEELETIGVKGFTSTIGITENKIRKEHNLRERIAHLHKK